MPSNSLLSSSMPLDSATSGSSTTQTAARDQGVTDEIWSQLQNDIRKQNEKDEARRQELKRLEDEARREAERQRQLAEELRLAQERLQREKEDARRKELILLAKEAEKRAQAARDEAERRRRALEEAKRQQEIEHQAEAATQRKLQSLGLCSAGFKWIKQASGYRCEAGGHFVSDHELR